MANDIVLTGTHGWLGSRLLYALVHGLPDYPDIQTDSARIRCFYRNAEPELEMELANGNVIENVSGDLSVPAHCEKLLSGTDEPLLFHTAGVIHPNRVKEFFTSNVDGTLNVLRAASRRGCRRAVIVSSNSPIGCNPTPDHRFTEESPYNPYQGYGRSKKEMELKSMELADRLGIELVIIRPPWFYGPFQPPRQTLFFQMIKNGGAPILGEGLNQRSMVYVDNLCQGMHLAATHPDAAGNTYWIADAEPYEMRTIIDTIESVLEEDFAMEVAHKRMNLPYFVSEIAGVVDAAIQATGLYHQKIHVLSEMNKNIACSIDKARRELGYEPKVALREGMKRSIGWCLEQGMTI
ncbi:MAG: NAD-dependent epimerase/dehydratase family protein [Gammaproteobacteria bacterium]